MLHVQKFLSENSLDQLIEQYSINVYHHPDRPLIGLKYNQIESPRSDPLVRECRGLVLEKDSWRTVAKPFNRFFNVGELQDEFEKFNWNDFTVTEKVDGSLIILYHYNGDWHVNTSGSFGLGGISGFSGSWRDLFWRYSGDLRNNLQHANKDRTYLFELCTAYNKVVKRYEQPGVFLLGSVDRHTFQESHELEVDDWATWLGVRRPARYHVGSKDEVNELLIRLEEQDPTNEGVIIRDNTGLRYKWKTKSYLAFHRLKDNGNIILPRNLVAIVMTGETSEVRAVMPEIIPALEEVEQELNKSFKDLLTLWLENRHLESQKDFAMKVKHHPFSGMLFNLRKTHGAGADEKELKILWRGEPDRVAEKLFSNKTFEFAPV